MKTNKTVSPLSSFLVATIIILSITLPRHAGAWVDDFESYPANTFPSPPWNSSGNSAVSIVDTVSKSGNQSFRLFGSLGGCWGAVVHRALNVTPPFEVEFNVRNGTETLTGCHPVYGGVNLGVGATWSSNQRGLIVFTKDGEIRAQGLEGGVYNDTFLDSFNPLQWYNVKIRYEPVDSSNIQLTYWINGQWKASEVRPAHVFESNLAFLEVWSGEGTAWFDDIKVTGEENLVLPTTIANQAANASFPITIEALSADGQRDTAFNNDVSLSINNSSINVSPNSVKLVNGYATENVDIDGATSGAVLQASYGTLSGRSNAFDVTDTVAITGDLVVSLYQFSGISFIGVPLNADSIIRLIDSSGGLYSCNTGAGNNTCTISNLTPGIYKLHAFYSAGGKSRHVNNVEIAPGRNTKRLSMYDTTKQPVLLVPGILGSTTEGFGDYSNANTYPRLTRNKPTPASKLKILDGVNIVADAGFKELRDEIESEYTVYPVPWDWRISLEQAWQEYLVPAINQALDPDNDGIDNHLKVHIVAHSMGGLLARAYIQSSLYSTRNDIDKFAMVGTPNMGSANAYYMVQGGDPVKTDQVSKNCEGGHYLQNPSCFYSRTTSSLHRKLMGTDPFEASWVWWSLVPVQDANLVKDHAALAYFYEKHVPTGRQLLPTYPMLKTGGGAPRVLSEVNNTFLEKLNGQTLSDFYTIADDPNPAGKVRTKIFASFNEETLLTINVSDTQPQEPIYQDGEPVGESLPINNSGDGTVPLCSAALLGGPGCYYELLGYDLPDPNNQNAEWATLFGHAKGKHANLVAKFKSAIHCFLNGICP